MAWLNGRWKSQRSGLVRAEMALFDEKMGVLSELFFGEICKRLNINIF
jgi:hypothetical protein